MDVKDAWHGLVKELSFPKLSTKSIVEPLRWGVCLGYPDLVEVKIEDALLDDKLHLAMSSYTKSRWTRFLRRYFRTDFNDWIKEAYDKLSKYDRRPFVASYSINLNPESKIVGVGAHGGHNYGGCLSSLQIRVCPTPTVILYSRACQIDKIGFLDLVLIHLVAKELARVGEFKKVKAQWVISLGFISAVSQTFYTTVFKIPLEGHSLERRIKVLRSNPESNYGPLQRLIKRNKQMTEDGVIPGAVPVKELSLEFKLSRKEQKKLDLAELEQEEFGDAELEEL
jgi:hypothetical protein